MSITYDDAGNTNVVMLEGYRTLGTPMTTDFIETHPRYERVWIPPTNGVIGTPAIPPTPAEIQKLKNEGWNSGARSINELAAGSYFIYTVSNGVSGAYLGIGPSGLEGRSLTSFTHALMSDRDGVHIFENGVKIETLKNQQIVLSKLRIYRHMDNTVVFVATTTHETLVYTSTTKYPSLLRSFVYGLLYASGDKVMSASLAAGEVLYASI